MTLEARNLLGNAAIDQVTIQSEVNHKRIIDIFYNKINEIEKFHVDKDNYSNELIKNIKIKKLNFPIHKHIELYILKNENNIKKIFYYLLFRYKFHISGYKKVNLGYPPFLSIEPVSACNLRCPFCFQTDKSFTRKPFMGMINLKFFKKVIDEANNIGVGAITLASRGEPTLHKQLGEMLEYASKKENIFEVKLNTNATFLSEKLCHIIFKNNITQLVISADHYIKEDFERLRKGANFEKIVSNVDMLYKIRKEFYPKSLTEIRISAVDFDRNLDRNKFHDFWIQRSDHVTAGYALGKWDTYNNSVDPKMNDACEFLWQRLYVWWDGKINPCDIDYKSYLNYGNLKKNTILEIWKSKTIEEYRKKHLNKNRKQIDPCNKCGQTFIK